MPPLHIVVIQPKGYIHSLGLLDHARYLRYQFRRLGCEVGLAKNRLREDALNIVFCAHRGFPAELTQRYACVFVNLEQLGADGAQMPPGYLALLHQNPVIDYDASHPAAYGRDAASVPLVWFGHAPYLQPVAAQAAPLAQRPIDLLFFGSVNPRRQAFLEKVQALGVKLTVVQEPLYGAERDALVLRAKAVLNCHAHASSRFEQARAFQCMSLGTPVISERTVRTQAPDCYQDTVFWLDDDARMAAFFQGFFGSPAYFEEAGAKLQQFQQRDPLPVYRHALQLLQPWWTQWCTGRAAEPWVPRQIKLGAGDDYLPGWLHLDSVARHQPDIVLDLAQPQAWPLHTTNQWGVPVVLQAGQAEQVYASGVLQRVADLATLMDNVLQLLKVGGQFLVEVPCGKATGPWPDPAQVRGFDASAWRWYTEHFADLGWLEHRFELALLSWLDEQLQPCQPPAAAHMRVGLVKVATTPAERSAARMSRPDFGGVEPDWPLA